ncbi:PREDICTED: solute carrier family 25 member 45-like [Priapulus caudatus]|uniref:Solute carrier family 25 member 45-like n=1 Tax=Priapulus caudatus TaxID=37621 RepID=A0ABM1EQC1_PRICU|nr:PREDICTED: solute carrier family 25 member 45-like [Priapulus caudatus]XP_014674393.1 PREDICTED: solute carrier family 25 member 45-like [Priapulus caudatus]
MEGGINFIAGWFGGVASIFVGHPFDTVKVRQQTLRDSAKLWHSVKSTYQYEGIPGFFKGILFPLLSIGAMNSVYFGIYTSTLRRLNTLKYGEKSLDPSYTDIYLAGCAGGIGQLFITCPTDLVKIKLQIQREDAKSAIVRAKATKPMYNGPWHCLYSVYREKGIRACYKGLGIQFVRDLPSFGLYILVYEFLSKQLEDKNGSVSSMSTMLAGGSAGSVSWIIIMPLDAIKSRLQADRIDKPQYRGVLHCFSDTCKQDGVRALFRGSLVCAVRAFPVNAVTFLVYEWTLSAIRYLLNES